MGKRRPSAGELLAEDVSGQSAQTIQAPIAPSSEESPALSKRHSSQRHSAGQALAASVEGVSEQAKTVVNLSERKSVSGSIKRGATDDGDPYLFLTFPIQGQADQVLNVSFLLVLQNLKEPFLEGVRRHCSKISPATRDTFAYAFRNGFVAYLKRHNPAADFSNLDHTMLWAYVRWQDSPSAAKGGNRPLSQGTSLKRIWAARMVFEGLRKDAVWGIPAIAVLKNYPRNTHKGYLEHSSPRTILSREVLESIHRAALTEIEEIRARMEEGARLLEEGNSLLAKGHRDYSQVAVALAAMAERYPETFPRGEQILKDDRQLGRAIYLRSWTDPKPLGVRRIASYRYAYARDLVPFVLALAIEGAYNSDTVLGITKSGIRTRNLLGVTVTTVEGPKARAKTGIYSKDLDPDVVGPWFTMLEKLTAPLRSRLPEHQRDRIFVFQREKSSTPKAFSQPRSGPSSDMCWKHSLRAFCERHSLPSFSLAQLRPTLLDQVGQREGSLVASRAGRHQTFQTTDNHYLGPGTRERERERLGVTVQLFERFIDSDGKVDVRRSARAADLDKGAATPGFVCLEPHASPIPGQRKHRLCRAYGACPMCPLSVGAPGDPIVVALWMALEQAIFRARDYLDPQHWLLQWAPVAARLLSMIRHVPDNVMVEARLYNFSLPPVG